MSYSFRIPEEDPICECRWDEARQRMDRDDCPFHVDLPDDPIELEEIAADSAEHDLQITETTSTENNPRSNEYEIAPKKQPERAIDRKAEAS